ncbi:Transport and Golgi organization 2-like [Scomber scombrus]|uniref:Transport and Golgi organization 2-like n=1 Tax=Scomber scombrus TaxID=13677 RepID=A0AAV1P7M8_SCOSC
MTPFKTSTMYRIFKNNCLTIPPSVEHWNQLKNIPVGEKAQEIQQLADANDTRGFFSVTKAIFVPSTDDSTTLKINADINSGRREHFEDIFNQTVSFDWNVTNNIPKQPVNNSLSVIPTMEEVKEALRNLEKQFFF